MYYPSALLPLRFLLIIFWGSTMYDESLFSGCFKNSLCLSAVWLYWLYLGVALFGFVLLGIYWSFWICKFMYFIKLGKFLVIIYLDNLSVPFTFSSPSWTLIMLILVYLMVSIRSLDSVHFIMFSFSSSSLIISNALPSNLLICLFVQICCWSPLVCFFQLQNYYLVPFYMSTFCQQSRFIYILFSLFVFFVAFVFF